jgi:ubiquinone/menaquinone biosynthesis C-methylase UbiE
VADHLSGFFPGTEMPVAEWWRALWPDPAAVVSAVGIAPGMDVIDLCSGDGWFTLPIARIAKGVTAVDIDAAMIEAARRRLVEAGLTNCRLARGDAYAVARLAPRPADFIFMANAFHGVPDKPRLARTVREALKPAGRFAVVNWHRKPREETVVLGEPRGPVTELRMAPEETIEAAEAGGLKFAKLVELAPYHYGALFER